MAVYPNKFCIGFCNWMINTSWQVLTPPRLDLINTIYTAAVAGSSVTDTEYNNFIQTTSWRQPFYQAYLDSSLPFSLPPLGTCDIWFSATGIRSNSINSFGNCLFNDQVNNIYNQMGGSIVANTITAVQNPFLTSIDTSVGLLGSTSYSFNSNQMFNVSNAGALTNNKSGYTIIVIGKGSSSASNRVALGFSIGTSAASARMYLGINPTGQWFGVSRRLDADAAATITSNDSTSNFKIVVFTMDYSTATGKLYENGILITTNAAMNTSGNTSATNSSASYLGGFNGAQTWPGILIDTLSFQTALSAADVLTISDWLNDIRGIY